MMMPGLPDVASEYVATRMNARYTQNGIVTASTSRQGPGGLGSAGRSLTAPCDKRLSALAGPSRVRAAVDGIMELCRPMTAGLYCMMRPPRVARNETPGRARPVRRMEAAARMLDTARSPQ